MGSKKFLAPILLKKIWRIFQYGTSRRCDIFLDIPKKWLSYLILHNKELPSRKLRGVDLFETNGTATADTFTLNMLFFLKIARSERDTI